MATTVEAIYEDGVLKLPRKLPLPKKTHVRVTIDNGNAGWEDAERSAWLKLREEALTKTWDKPDDDVFNELRER
jgi:predicted DNA-binding antitoxin AbrB/MazE fold protein